MTFQETLLYYSKERPNSPSAFVKTSCTKDPKKLHWMNKEHHHICSSTPARATVPQIDAGAILQSLSLNLWTFFCPVYSPPPHPTKGKPSLKISKHPLLLSFLVCYSLHRFLLTVTAKFHLLLAIILVRIAPLLILPRYLQHGKFTLDRLLKA